LGVTLLRIDATYPADLPPAIRRCIDERADVLLCAGALFNSEQAQLIALVALARLPAIYAYSATVHAGGLAAYGSDLPYNYRRAAEYVDRILKGTTLG
jgi:putative ABC transport system substrate-binding protein